MSEQITFEKEAFKKEVLNNIKYLFRKTRDTATDQEMFQAVAYAVRDIIIDNWLKTHKQYEEEDAKTVYYLSMEFLMGRALGNNLLNLCCYREVAEALKELGIDTEKGLRYCQNDRGFYKSLVLQFATEAMTKKVDIERYYESGELDNYAILVHALKSTSKMIGALELSEKARLLEEAAKSSDIGYVERNHEDMFARYESITNGIRVCFGIDETDASTDNDDAEILEFSPGDGGGEAYIPSGGLGSMSDLSGMRSSGREDRNKAEVHDRSKDITAAKDNDMSKDITAAGGIDDSEILEFMPVEQGEE